MFPDKDPLDSTKIDTFSQEALAQLQLLEVDLLTLQMDHDATKMRRLRNTTHSLKESAATLGWRDIEALARSLENTLQVCGQQTLDIDRDLHRLLLQAYFCLRIPLLAQIQLGQYDTASALSRAKSVYDQLANKVGKPLEEKRLANIAESCTEINGVLLAIGLNQWMREIEAIIAHPHHHPNLARVLMMKAKILEAMGEYFDVMGLMVAGRNMLRALQSSPQGPFLIAQQTIHTLRRAQNLISLDEPGFSIPTSSTFTVTVEPESPDSDRSRSPEPAIPNSNALSPIDDVTQIGSKQFVCLVDSVILTLPFQTIAEIFSPQPDKIKHVDGKRFVYWREQMLLMHRLLDLVSWLPPSPVVQPKKKSVLVLQKDSQFLALELNIERLINASDIIIQPLSAHRPFCLGSTLLLENRLSFVIDGLAAFVAKHRKTQIDSL